MKAGAPEGIIGWIDVPSLELTNMADEGSGHHPGHRRPGHGEGRLLLRQARPGRGRRQHPRHHRRHAPTCMLAVNSIIHSKTFDNGMICASEQSVIVLDKVYDAGEEGICRPRLLFPEAG